MIKKFNLGFIALVVLIFSFACSKKITGITSDKMSVQMPDKISFKAVNTSADKYMWNFGDGGSSTEMNPVYRYTISGTHTVTLTTIKNNKSSITKMNVEVKASHDKCLVQIETKFGNMLVQLFDETPQHRDNFIKLADQAFYDDLIFHRVINGFMIQGGDPNSRNSAANTQLGSGGPDYTIPAEFNKKYCHVKGALAAARTGDAVNPQKRSSGSQFYIVQGSPQTESGISRMEDQKGFKYTEEQKTAYKEKGGTPFLDQEYTVFGQVIEGLEIIDKIAAVQTARGDRPVEDVKMKVKVLH